MQIFIATFTLVPVRFCLSFILFLFACGSASVGHLFLTLSRVEGRQREVLRKQLLRLPLLLLRAMLFVSGIDCIDCTDDPEAGQRAAPILLFAPHTSFFDLYPGIFMPELPCWVARAESQHFLFFRHFLSLAGVIFVKRESDSSRKETLDLITKAAATHKIAICPEGTCGNGSHLMRFKTGAFTPGLPVQPVIVKYTNSSGLDTTSWTFDGISFFTIAWLTLCNFWTRIEVKKLPAYYPSEEEKADARLFADNVRTYVSRKSGIPTTPYIFDDVFFFGIAKAYEIPRTSICIKFLKIAHKVALEQEGGKPQERTARTLRGLRSEDGNLLFSRSDYRKDAHKATTLSVLRDMTTNLKTRLAIVETLSSPDEAISLLLEASGSQQLSSKANALHELRECLEGRDVRVTLLIAALLCDLSERRLWDRIRECVHRLSPGPSTGLSASDTQCLLWVLLGVADGRVQEKLGDDVTFAFLRRNLKTLPHAVHQAIA